MHLAAHLLTGERLWILKGFQREVIHNFDCISSSWSDAAGLHAFSNSVNGPLFLIYIRIFSPNSLHWFYHPVWESLITIGEAVKKINIELPFQKKLENVRKQPTQFEINERKITTSPRSSAVKDDSCQTAKHNRNLTNECSHFYLLLLGLPVI